MPQPLEKSFYRATAQPISLINVSHNIREPLPLWLEITLNQAQNQCWKSIGSAWASITVQVQGFTRVFTFGVKKTGDLEGTFM